MGSIPRKTGGGSSVDASFDTQAEHVKHSPAIEEYVCALSLNRKNFANLNGVQVIVAQLECYNRRIARQNTPTSQIVQIRSISRNDLFALHPSFCEID
jgi:hypothetical protein